MKGKMKSASIILAAALGVMIGSAAQAGPLENMQAVLVSLQKARMSSAAPVKARNLARAKEQLASTAYDGGGHRAAALALTSQAIDSANQLNMDKANRQIDMAIVKVKHTIQAIKQETAARKRLGGGK
ncbi:MAG TPA: hypothetical protein PLD91_07315 [Spirochaetota bacterium]|nr:hypothetical protein [Spirochaetota bacterium]HQJ71103.1 hypothetical protein [Spirochaetota bacterium]